MNFQQALLDAQYGALGMDEALALLDGFDLSTTCDHQDQHYPTSYSCGSSTASNSSDELCSTTTPDDSMFAQLTESTACENLSADWEVFPETTLDHQLPLKQPQQLQAEPQQLVQTQQQKKQKKKTTRPRKAAAVPKVKKPRKHNRIEILKLRELIEQLQLQHSDLQKSTATAREGRIISASASVAVAAQLATQKQGNGSTLVTATGGADAPRSVWLELVTEQYRLRQHSEGLNRKLRDAVSKQLKMTNSLQALLQKKVSPQDVELLLDAPLAAADVQDQLVNPQGQILVGLYRSVESHFHETNLVYHGIRVANDVTSVSSASNAKQDAVRGPTFEFTTSTPTASSFQLIGRLMWSRSIKTRDTSEVQTTQTSFSRRFHEKRVQMAVPSSVGNLQVNGVVVACKFEEAHRTVITVAAAYTVNDSCLVFRENAWFIVTEGPADEKRQSWDLSPSSALVQTLVRSYSEKQDPRSSTGSSPLTKVPDAKTTCLQEVVTKALADHTRQHMGALQKSLLSKSDSIELSTINFKCPMVGCTC